MQHAPAGRVDPHRCIRVADVYNRVRCKKILLDRAGHCGITGVEHNAYRMAAPHHPTQ